METPGPEAPGNSGVNQLWDACRLRGPPKALHPPAHQGPAQAKAQLSDKPGRHDDHSASPVSLFPLRLPSPRPCGFGGKAEAEGLGQAVRSLAYAWLRPLCPSFPNVPPYAPAPLWGCSVGRLLTICALISLPGASWSGGAYQGSAPVRWAFRSPWARGGVAAGALALQGLEAASPFLGLHILLPPPPLPPPPLRAAFFTTSGYRPLHEFRSQWNYFRILVNRKLGVFHKLSITAVWWEEPGLGTSNGYREAPVH